MRVGEPWRHLAKPDRFLNGRGPGTRLLIGEQRHRADFAGPMTFLAAILKDGENVLIKGRVGRTERAGRADQEQGEETRDNNHRLPIIASDG